MPGNRSIRPLVAVTFFALFALTRSSASVSASATVTTLTGFNAPYAVAVNPATNFIYVTNGPSQTNPVSWSTAPTILSAPSRVLEHQASR
jgi:DNA-binding beta-propeller fold protein YncE